MITLACINCAYTIATPIIGMVAIFGGLAISCFKCFCLRFKKRKNCKCSCHNNGKKKDEKTS